MKQLSMSSAQSLHKMLKNEITLNHNLINIFKQTAAHNYKLSIPDTVDGKDAFFRMNSARNAVRALKVKNKKLAQTALELKRSLRN